MSDKFKINAFIIALATISILVIHRIANAQIQAQIQISEVEYIKIQPDIMVFITALCVMNMMSVLTTELTKINPIKIVALSLLPNGYRHRSSAFHSFASSQTLFLNAKQ